MPLMSKPPRQSYGEEMRENARQNAKNAEDPDGHRVSRGRVREAEGTRGAERSDRETKEKTGEDGKTGALV